MYFFYTQQSYVLYKSLFLRQKKKREQIHTINWKKKYKKTQKRQQKKKGEWLIPMLARNTKEKRVRVWRIGLYIYICDVIHQNLNFSASAEILIGF